MTHTAAGSEVVVGKSDDVAEGSRLVVSVGGKEIGIFRVDGKLYAWSNYCVHQGGPVCQGLMINRVVERLDDDKGSLGDFFADSKHIVCPWHGYEFDLKTGEHPADPKLKLRQYSTRESKGAIFVEL